MKLPVKVGFCIAYDWYYLKTSLALIYPFVDKICLSIDKDRISWAGKKYEFDNNLFYELIKFIDKEGKIDLYEEDFHRSDLSPMENEVRQRNMMATKLGKENSWHIQLDADEYFINFEGFCNYLNHFNPARPVNINCVCYTMFKQVEGGYLFIKPSRNSKIEFFPIASNIPHYEFGRRNGYFNIKTNFAVVHQSWARKEDEILQKINNWGHKDDFDVSSYFTKWQDLSKSNYNSFKNFHPIDPSLWESLVFVEAKSKEALIEKLKEMPLFNVSSLYLLSQNSIWISRARAVASKFF